MQARTCAITMKIPTQIVCSESDRQAFSSMFLGASCLSFWSDGAGWGRAWERRISCYSHVLACAGEYHVTGDLSAPRRLCPALRRLCMTAPHARLDATEHETCFQRRRESRGAGGPGCRVPARHDSLSFVIPAQAGIQRAEAGPATARPGRGMEFGYAQKAVLVRELVCYETMRSNRRPALMPGRLGVPMDRALYRRPLDSRLRGNDILRLQDG